MRIVFHAGIPKTGTTSIQATLAFNPRVLAKRGIAYPLFEAPKSRQHLLSALAVPYEERERIFDPLSAQDWADAKEHVTETLKQTVASEPEVIVLSAENAFLYPFETQQRLADAILPFGNVSAVLWLRDPIDHFRSYRAQMLKSVPGSDRKVPPPPPADYSPLFRERVAGIEQAWGNVSVFLYGPNAVENFIKKALPEANGLRLNIRTNNVSEPTDLDAETIAALKVSCADDIAFLDEIRQSLQDSEAGSPGAIPSHP